MVTHQKPPSGFKEMNGKIGYKHVCLYKKEREIRTGTKFTGDEMRYAWYSRYLYPPFLNKL